jgi:hypothetical protein
MSNTVDSQPKQLLSTETIADSRWVKVYKDRMLSNGGFEMEYWRVDRTDTAIILSRQKGRFILPSPQLRPGIKKITLDFLGGRLDAQLANSNGSSEQPDPQPTNNPADVAERIVRREFHIQDAVPLDLKPLTTQPLYVDSSFSSQRLYGYTVELPNDLDIPGDHYNTEELVQKLQCLQCRALLMEWIHNR